VFRKLTVAGRNVAVGFTDAVELEAAFALEDADAEGLDTELGEALCAVIEDALEEAAASDELSSPPQLINAHEKIIADDISKERYFPIK
jgi:hypothetical protein